MRSLVGACFEPSLNSQPDTLQVSIALASSLEGEESCPRPRRGRSLGGAMGRLPLLPAETRCCRQRPARRQKRAEREGLVTYCLSVASPHLRAVVPPYSIRRRSVRGGPGPCRVCRGGTRLVFPWWGREPLLRIERIVPQRRHLALLQGDLTSTNYIAWCLCTISPRASTTFLPPARPAGGNSRPNPNAIHTVFPIAHNARNFGGTCLVFPWGRREPLLGIERIVPQ